MNHISARSPVLRILRNCALLWVVLSVLGLLAGLAFAVYAAFWGCTAQDAVPWGACAVGFPLMVILSSVGSLFLSGVMLLFAQLFYMAGADVRQTRSSSLGQSLADEAIDVAGDILD